MENKEKKPEAYFLATQCEVKKRYRDDDITRCESCGGKLSVTKRERVIVQVELVSSGKTKNIPNATIMGYIMGALSKVPKMK